MFYLDFIYLTTVKTTWLMCICVGQEYTSATFFGVLKSLYVLYYIILYYIVSYIISYHIPYHILYYIIIYYIIYLTVIALTPGGSSTEHIYTQTIHRIQRMEHT
jgi:hypothetical protein